MMDPGLAVGAELPAVETTWDERDVILYHLGLGVGVPPTDPRELAYVYEKDLEVLPTFATAQALPILRSLPEAPGISYDARREVHGEQELIIHCPIPSAGSSQTTARIIALYDKGPAAVAVVEAETRMANGTLCATNRFTSFMRGAGGFGGERGPSTSVTIPDRIWDANVRCATFPQQALTYRLSGDWNPLHADPEAAKYAGFDRPILHGLATFGMALRGVIEGMLDARADSVSSYRGRFLRPVYPGDVLHVRGWWQSGDLLIEVVTDRNTQAMIGRVVPAPG
jgi:acyl dehydratase